ncbi:Y-family DNA polymerase [uncultured Prevotella sp.]|uniref:Y-family DNA polymerase n=1 Tax=uncultured Prevotella sp. TaxID=159272 RepID=UPI002598E38D|nr:Y-family DNA polymerase [uncultured Prevotella sp.]
MYAIFDCDNCYCSCERVFRPDLVGKPVVVLSNNDGCVVARSAEAKALGIPAGMPYFQLKEQFGAYNVTAFSSNYELYGEMTARVMSLITKACPYFYRYSIDEAFCDLSRMRIDDLKKWGEDLHKKILKWTGIPVSIGIAPTKTLAKCADRFAKDYKGYNHCCVIDSDEKREKALKLFPIDKVWGIGRRYADRLLRDDVHTAWEFTQLGAHWVRSTFNINALRTWQELKGIDCVPTEQMTTKKSICTSRSFPGMIDDFTALRTHVSNYAARCSEKLRKQHSVCSMVTVFIDTNHFRPDLPQYDNACSKTFLTPVNTTQEVVSGALECLKRIFRTSYKYKRAGVIVSGISGDNPVQTDFTDYNATAREKLRRLTEAVDNINRRNGSETIVLGSQQYTAKDGKGKADTFRNAIKHDLRSPNYTTRWSDILIVR